MDLHLTVVAGATALRKSGLLKYGSAASPGATGPRGTSRSVFWQHEDPLEIRAGVPSSRKNVPMMSLQLARQQSRMWTAGGMIRAMAYGSPSRSPVCRRM